MFQISSTVIDVTLLRMELENHSSGSMVEFTGMVRNLNDGQEVKALEYEVYHELAVKEGNRILDEARKKFPIKNIIAVHREGNLALGETAVWIGVTTAHRDEGFRACRYIIDEIKSRLPIWKKEHYLLLDAKWVYCGHDHKRCSGEETIYYRKQKELLDRTLLMQKKVIIVGAGGLGCPVLTSLATAGVGQIVVIDPDTVELSNLHRQPLYSYADIGKKKVMVARERIVGMNPFVKIEALPCAVSSEHLIGDLVIDCTDNMRTRLFLHDTCHRLRIPLISAAIFQHEGLIRTFIPGKGCLRCTGEISKVHSVNCNDGGVIGAYAMALGALAAGEALMYLNTESNSTIEHTLFFNFAELSQFKVKNALSTDCPTCSGDVAIDVGLDLEVNLGEMPILDIRDLTDEEIFLRRPQDVALACHMGERSRGLALFLREEGLRTYSLRGGLCPR